MRVAIVGAGPAGLLLAGGLARRGHRVLAIDRDAGPSADGRWARRGVMQFAHAHGFRPQVSAVLKEEWPAAHETWLAMGAEANTVELPDGTKMPGGMLSRRLTFERALRRAAATTAGLDVRVGHVEGLAERRGGRVRGLRVDGAMVEADLVVDASGRAGKMPRSATAVGGECGIAYVNRPYRLHPGASRGPTTSPIGWFGSFDGYLVLLFPHERGHFSVVLVRPTADAALKRLRYDAVFDAVCRSVPGLAEWTDASRSRPTAGVMAGGALRNTYHAQLMRPGLVAVGDSVTTTAPTAGRGIAMTALQVQELLRLLDSGADPAVAEPFGAWCDREMLPWVVDHVAMDGGAALRWQGHDVDLARPLPSDLIVAAATVEPRLQQYVGPYLAMTALPATLAPAEPLAREVYQRGWRPAYAEGPTRDEVVEIIDRALAAAA